MKNLESRASKNKHGENIQLKILTPDDVTEAYVNWLNDEQVNKYLESRFSAHTIKSAKEYVCDMYLSERDALFGIFCETKHAGNIKIGNIHPVYKRADIGLMIGKEHWHKGIGSIVIGLAEEIAFEQLGLHKVYAGIYSDNVGSVKVFLNNSWRMIGELRDHYMINGTYVNCVMMEKLRFDKV